MTAVPCRRRFLTGIAAAAITGAADPAWAVTARGRPVLRADPDNYRRLLRDLKPGDTLALEAGEYRNGLPIHGLVATAERPIVIEGPRRSGAAVFLARPGANTVSIVDSAHVTIRDLTLEGRRQRVDAVKGEGHARWAHHITLERLAIAGHDADQQNVGISTKCPAWGWVVRGCTITGAGTGMYFGNSDGSAPFFSAVIEDNRVLNPIGYALQIKHQRPRPAFEAMPTTPAVTIVRRNVFIKSQGGAERENARPNMLVGHWPLVGPGTDDRYLIYGNLLFDNPTESLFQGEGNLAFYNNLLFNPHGEGMRIQPHNDKPRAVAVFRNTIVASALGIEFVGGEPGYERRLDHNFVYGNPPLQSEVDGENRTGAYEEAGSAFGRLAADLHDLDLTPTGDPGMPTESLGARWLALPGAGEDYLGRPRRSGGFGACASRAANGFMRCGLPLKIEG